MANKLFPAIATLTGTMMGAGYLAIPYVVSKTGFFPGFFLIIFLGFFIMLIMLYFGEVILRTNGNHQLTGYVEKYRGKKWKFFMFFSMVFGIYSALLAYLIAEGESLSFLVTGNTSYSIYFGLLFLVILSFLTYIGLTALKKFESFGLMLVLILIILILVYFLPSVKSENLYYINLNKFFLPFGVIFFSFLAFSALPEMKREISTKKILLKKAIIYGIVIVISAYSLFTFIVVGYKGENVPEIATFALGKIFILLGIITMFNAFFALTIALRDMYRFDFNIKRTYAWLLVVSISLVLYLIISIFHLATFTQILSIAGILSGGSTGITILLMNKKAKILGKRKPEYSIPINWKIIVGLILIFLLGVFLEFYTF